MSAPRRFGDWELLERLHDGGMAAVWLARKGQGEAVVLKLVHERFAQDATFRRMLEEEARVAARVEHPNVVRIVEFGEVDAIPYLAMERCDGATLAAVLDHHGALPVASAVAIAARTASGLHAAHEARGDDGALLELVHRDVSPSNVMLGRDGAVTLIDFGVAKARGRAIKTSAGTLKGKFRYMPPEAITGQPLDRRADIYALGIVLWEMLTGRRYFDAKLEVEVLFMARNPRWTPPSRLRPEVPDALDRALEVAMAPRAADRWPTASRFADALRDATPEARDLDDRALAELSRATRLD